MRSSDRQIMSSVLLLLLGALAVWCCSYPGRGGRAYANSSDIACERWVWSSGRGAYMCIRLPGLSAISTSTATDVAVSSQSSNESSASNDETRTMVYRFINKSCTTAFRYRLNAHHRRHRNHNTISSTYQCLFPFKRVSTSSYQWSPII